MQINAAIFDMDGLLVDSEPLWKRAEQAVFGQLGLRLTDEMCEQTRGRRIDDVVAYWYRFKPWPDPDFVRTRTALLERVDKLIQTDAVPLPGVDSVLRRARALGLRIGLASSSPFALIDAVLAALDLRPWFDAIVSAEHEPHGKPHPAVYLKAAAALGVAPARCVAFEDSVPGLQAAKAAGMYTVAVPDTHCRDDAAFDAADCKLRQLDEFSFETLAATRPDARHA